MKIYKYYILVVFLALSNFILAQQLDSLSVQRKGMVVHQKFPENFKTDYQSEDFVYEKSITAKTHSVWDSITDAIFRALDGLFETPEGASKFVSILIKVIYIIVIVLVVYFIVKTLVNDDGNWIFGRNSDHLNINTSEIEKQLLETDFDKLILEAKTANNYRLAVRYYYLKALKVLAEKEFIIWEFEKTNQDYFYELKDKTIKDKFSYISYIYNYSWYGEFQLDGAGYLEAENSFNELFKLLK